MSEKIRDDLTERDMAFYEFGPHCIETLVAGVWDTQDVADGLAESLMLASSLCQQTSEDRIRISTPDFRIL